MNRLRMVGIYLVVALFVGFTAGSFDALAADKTPEQKTDQKATEKGLQDSLGVPILTGDLWKEMTHDCKVAFIWGFGHLDFGHFYVFGIQVAQCLIILV